MVLQAVSPLERLECPKAVWDAPAMPTRDYSPNRVGQLAQILGSISAEVRQPSCRLPAVIHRRPGVSPFSSPQVSHFLVRPDKPFAKQDKHRSYRSGAVTVPRAPTRRVFCLKWVRFNDFVAPISTTCVDDGSARSLFRSFRSEGQGASVAGAWNLKA